MGSRTDGYDQADFDNLNVAAGQTVETITLAGRNLFRANGKGRDIGCG